MNPDEQTAMTCFVDLGVFFGIGILRLDEQARSARSEVEPPRCTAAPDTAPASTAAAGAGTEDPGEGAGER